jgi:hypothetical protein
VKTIGPAEMSRSYLSGTLSLFDAVISFSSLEHSGLGRYGDAINPWGDLMTMARAWCVTKNSGRKTDVGRKYILFVCSRTT